MRLIIFLMIFFLVQFLWHLFVNRKKQNRSTFLFQKFQNLEETQEIFDRTLVKLFIISFLEVIFYFINLLHFKWSFLFIPINTWIILSMPVFRMILLFILERTESRWVNNLMIMTGLPQLYFAFVDFNDSSGLQYTIQLIYVFFFFKWSIKLTRAVTHIKNHKINS
jgi:hypothetical protein